MTTHDTTLGDLLGRLLHERASLPEAGVITEIAVVFRTARLDHDGTAAYRVHIATPDGPIDPHLLSGILGEAVRRVSGPA